MYATHGYVDSLHAIWRPVSGISHVLRTASKTSAGETQEFHGSDRNAIVATNRLKAGFSRSGAKLGNVKHAAAWPVARHGRQIQMTRQTWWNVTAMSEHL